MKRNEINSPAVILLLIAVSLIAVSCDKPNPNTEYDDLGAFLDSLIVVHHIPGFSFAVFNDSGILYEHVSGFKNADAKEPVDAGTTFEAASISKPLFAYIVLSLARDGYLDIDAPIASFPDLSYDDRFSRLTPRILLSHQAGLPNWRSRLNFDAKNYEELFAPDDTLRFIVAPQTEYRYSGEGYVLLQRFVEQTMGKDLNALAKEIVFDPLGMRRSSFLFDEAIRENTSMGHDADMNPNKWEISTALASTTLHTNASDLARFGSHLASGLREASYLSEMARPNVEVERVDHSRTTWGLGLGIVEDEKGKYLYHGGNNVLFIADLIYGYEENLGYILLTNSSNGSEIIEEVERRIFGRDIVR